MFDTTSNKDVETLIEEDPEIKILNNLKALGFFFDISDVIDEKDFKKKPRDLERGSSRDSFDDLNQPKIISKLNDRPKTELEATCSWGVLALFGLWIAIFLVIAFSIAYFLANHQSRY